MELIPLPPGKQPEEAQMAGESILSLFCYGAVLPAMGQDWPGAGPAQRLEETKKTGVDFMFSPVFINCTLREGCEDGGAISSAVRMRCG